jgi:glycosyltransferase involved in cell wall biosynthesis
MKNQNMPIHLICLSHLRWDFVYQRPQHLLSRFAKNVKVYFYEEPIFNNTENNFLSVSRPDKNLNIITPHLRANMDSEEVNKTLTSLFDQFMINIEPDNCLFWYYTPMALQFTNKHKPKAIVYDCMDELAAFKFAHSEIAAFEKKLMAKADLVFTGGQSLYEAKKQYHDNIFPFPSSIDKKHFQKCANIHEAQDQANIKGPKIGFFGVIDERFDIDLIKNIADQKPDWQIILIGPVVKIDPNSLPKNKNIHYFGIKSYQELPAYMAGWDVALIPFLLNESTRFISPTKTPEYLAANLPVVSTPIRDVVNPYGIQKLVHICTGCDEFITAITKELTNTKKEEWQLQVTHFLKKISWDSTYKGMYNHIKSTINNLNKISIAS